MSEAKPALDLRAEALRHQKLGWAALLAFLLLGMLLEAMHGFKLGFYLDVANETRRTMWTLAHAHGTLIALVNVAFALSLPQIPIPEARFRLASRCLLGATVLMPAGFFLGGLDIRSGDPGLGVVLAPVGGALMIVGVAIVALAALDTRDG